MLGPQPSSRSRRKAESGALSFQALECAGYGTTPASVVAMQLNAVSRWVPMVRAAVMITARLLPALATDLWHHSSERRRNEIEHRVELSADGLHRNNDNNRD